MLKNIIVIVIILLFHSVTLHAQAPDIRGTVIDTTSFMKLYNASVSVITEKDSLLVTHTRAAKDGSFSFNKLLPNKYIVLISYPKYVDYVATIDLEKNKAIDLGKINMLLASHLLEEIVIKGRQRITIKGDTTEYDAASFNLQPNAKVEDLLKQLPGITVNQDGSISAQGKTVEKVLVDGEEFFGDDPTLVTRNIKGNMVDKVQLYDKKSDQATFTGVDDGKKTKTINIQLKEDSKKGYFGKADGGVGTGKYYESQLMFNRFKGKQKFSLYGTLSNTNKIGLGFNDANKYSSSGDMEFGEGGMIFTYSSGDELESFDGSYNGEGIPTAANAGVNYANKWNKDKHSLNVNYKVGHIEVEGNKNSINIQNLPSGSNTSTSNEDFDRKMFRQKLNARYDVSIDSLTRLIIKTDATIRNSDTYSDFQSESIAENNQVINNNKRKTDNNTDDRNLNISVQLARKFKKTGRSLSAYLRSSLNNSQSKGYLNSTTQYFNRQNGNPDSMQRYDQQKNRKVSNNSFSSNVVYTEPLSKNLSVLLSYTFSLYSGESNLRSLNKDADNNYSLLDTLYSNQYSMDQTINEAGATFNHKTKKHKLSWGAKIADVRFKQLDQYRGTTFKRDFINFNPRISYTMSPSQQKSFNIEYSGNNTQPQLSQIQPVRINTDPLNIVVGNPTLKASFTNRINMSYYSYKVLSNQYFNTYGSFQITHDPIISNTSTDANGASVYKYENLHSHDNISFYTGIFAGKKMKKPELDINLSANLNGNINYNIINGDINQTKSFNYSGRIGLNKTKANKYDFNFGLGPSYTSNVSSLQRQNDSKGWGFNGNGSANFYLPGKIQMGTDLNYTFTKATQVFAENFERLILNAYVTKKFLKKDNLQLRFAGNDLLNQNVGFNRFANNNIISQSSYTTIKRYFLLSLIWDFDKMGGN